MWGKIKKVLGVLTDLLLIGRTKGWWEKGQGPDRVFAEELKKEDK